MNSLSGRQKFILVIIALAIGVTAILALISFVSILGNPVQHGSSYLLGFSAILIACGVLFFLIIRSPGTGSATRRKAKLRGLRTSETGSPVFRAAPFIWLALPVILVGGLFFIGGGLPAPEGGFILTALLVVLICMTGFYSHSMYRLLNLTTRSLELLEHEGKIRKVREIALELLRPLQNRAREMKTLLIESKVYTITDKGIDLELGPGLSGYFDERMKEILLDENYDEPVFQAYIWHVKNRIGRYDAGIENFSKILVSNYHIIRSNRLLPMINRASLDYFGTVNPGLEEGARLIAYHLLHKTAGNLMFTDFPRETAFWERNLTSIVHALAADDFTNNLLRDIELQRNALIRQLDGLSSEIDEWITRWANTYHIPGREG